MCRYASSERVAESALSNESVSTDEEFALSDP